jgi:hypothetical protein
MPPNALDSLSGGGFFALAAATGLSMLLAKGR